VFRTLNVIDEANRGGLGLPTSGSPNTTKSDRTMRWVACRQRAIARNCSRKTPLYNCLLDGEPYGSSGTQEMTVDVFCCLSCRKVLARIIPVVIVREEERLWVIP
jgi:hypothetical protein